MYRKLNHSFRYFVALHNTLSCSAEVVPWLSQSASSRSFSSFSPYPTAVLSHWGILVVLAPWDSYTNTRTAYRHLREAEATLEPRALFEPLTGAEEAFREPEATLEPRATFV